jgi:formylglycine-generating enzyme required for sulfatase activity
MKGLLVLSSAAVAAVLLMVQPSASEAAAPPGPVGPNEFRDCPDVCPVMVRVPAGTFQMGDASAAAPHDQHPVRAITLRAFAVGKFEVTHGEYAAFVDASGYKPTAGCMTDRRGGRGWGFDPEASWLDPGYAYTDRHPAVCLNWADANAYVAWLSSKTGKAYRLLSEAEWEYADRAGTTTRFWWGDKAEDMCANTNGGDLAMQRHFTSWPPVNCDDGYVFTAPAGSFRANAFGLYDMAGNVWEWTADCYAPYGVQPTDGRAYPGGDCGNRVLRGGSWGWGVVDLLSAQRNALPPAIKGGDAGLRVARDL